MVAKTEDTCYNICIGSMPRCGSTMVARAIAGLDQDNTWPKDHTEQVFKTHQGPPDFCNKGIYIFGDVVKCILSTHRRFRNDIRHFRNCGCDKHLDDIDIFRCDEMNLEYYFDMWTNNDKYPTMLIRYSAIPKHYDDIEDFVGHKCNFPEWKERNTHADHHPMIVDTYDSLIKRINKIQDFQIIGVE